MAKKKRKSPSINGSIEALIARSISGPSRKEAEAAQNIQVRGTKLVAITQQEKVATAQSEQELLQHYKEQLAACEDWDKNQQDLWQGLIDDQQESMRGAIGSYDQFSQNITNIATEFGRRAIK